MGDSCHEAEEEEEERGEDIESEVERHQSEMDSEDADSENEEVEEENDKYERKSLTQNGDRGWDEELVKLPCDLPSWNAITGHLEELAG